MLTFGSGVCVGLMVAVLFPGAVQVVAEKGGAALVWVKSKFKA